MAPNAPRPFTTSARVHPALPTFDPHTIAKMQSSAPASRARLGKFFLPVTGILFVGVAASSYLDKRYSPTHSSGLSAAEARALRQREQNAALMSAYGDRSSVEDLQRAMELYEAEAASKK